MLPSTFDHTHTLCGDVGDFVSLLKPRVMSLVIFTSICGLILAPGHLHPALSFIAIFSIAMGAGGSACLNMWWECDLDKKMKRTQNRPIPQGKISRSTAFSFGIILSIGSVYFMAIAINYVSALLLAFTIFFYVVIYTMILKPSTPHNIVIGGVAGALPPVIGWSCVTGNVSFPSFSLFFIIFFWTVPHFWALALVKKEDYLHANIPMMPNTAGDFSTKKQMLFYAILTVFSSFLPYYYDVCHIFYVGIALLLGVPFLLLTLFLFSAKELKKWAYSLFAYSIVYLFLLFLSMVVDK